MAALLFIIINELGKVIKKYAALFNDLVIYLFAASIAMSLKWSDH